jgi:prepilin-type N-terminal cleavage/methylation domain-containing protein
MIGTPRGFTLVELMITVVIVGLLAAIGFPQLAGAKDRAYVASMKADLRNLSTHEESHFYDKAVYTSDLALLTAAGFQLSQMVSATIVEATASGWSATVDHVLSGVQCGLFVGTAAPVSAAIAEGVVACQ